MCCEKVASTIPPSGRRCFQAQICTEKKWYKVNSKRDFNETKKILETFGHIFRSLSMEFEITDNKCKCKYVSLLKHCTELPRLKFENVELDNLSINWMEIGVLRNLCQFSLYQSLCTAENLKTYLSSAFNPSKLRYLAMLSSSKYEISDDLLASIVDRFVNIKILSISLITTTALFAKNVSKLKNLKRLTQLHIRYTYINMPILPIINEVAKCKCIEKLTLQTHSVPDEGIAEAIDNLSGIRKIILQTILEIPENVLEKMTKSREVIYTYTRALKYAHSHVYQFERSVLNATACIKNPNEKNSET